MVYGSNLKVFAGPVASLLSLIAAKGNRLMNSLMTPARRVDAIASAILWSWAPV